MRTLETALPVRPRRVQDQFPASHMVVSRQLKWDRLMMGVEQDEQSFPLDALAGLIDILDHVSGPEHPQTADETRVPTLVIHLLFRGIEPRDIFDLSAADAAALEELSPLKHRLLLAELDQLADEIQQLLVFLGQFPVDPGEI